MTAVVRFAPSPTGFLHIGGARTALFNWLFARHHGGTFRLRIEDTDRSRSTPDAVAAIIEGLDWLGLSWDGEIVYQSARATRHAEVAQNLLAAARAYRCYCTPAELAAMREKARTERRSVRYDGTWRDRDPSEAPPGVSPVIRLKAPHQGSTTIHDRVQGDVTIANSELDDLIILRADGSPTYNLSVVVDDHDMAITHVIRGDDHLNNAFRQTQIYKALDWPVPEFAHVPLIHGPDGTKMSKRHGAVGTDAYRDLGYLPEAMRNYLLRLGWSHGDDETISTDQAIAWFELDAVGRAPARFDFAKLDNLNGHYIRAADGARLTALMAERLEGTLGHPLGEAACDRLRRAIPGLKPRAKTLVELAEKGRFYVADRPIAYEPRAQMQILNDIGEYSRFPAHPHPTDAFPSRGWLAKAGEYLKTINEGDWDQDRLSEELYEFARRNNVNIGVIAQPIRAALTGSTASPGLFEVMEVLGREESLGRIADAVSLAAAT